jgi:hypothetical protein
LAHFGDFRVVESDGWKKLRRRQRSQRLEAVREHLHRAVAVACKKRKRIQSLNFQQLVKTLLAIEL